MISERVSGGLLSLCLSNCGEEEATESAPDTQTTQEAETPAPTANDATPPLATKKLQSRNG